MGLLDSLVSSALPGGNQSASLGTSLLSVLSQESGGRGSAATGAAAAPPEQNPAAVSDGLSELVQRFENGGLGDVVRSWIGSGQNQQIAPDELHRALGPQTIDRLAQHTGLDRSQLLPLLAQALPAIIDRLTPNGRVPDRSEVAQMQQAGSDHPIET